MHVATSPSHRDPLRLIEIPTRRLRRGEVRARVRAIGVNPVDWKMREGGPLRMLYRLLGPWWGPLVVGVDFAGEVIELGPGVTGIDLGARVVGGTDFTRDQLGSYADEVIVRPDQVALVPGSVSLEEAACLPVAAVTPWIVITEHRPIAPGEKVLILGAAGGVGLFAIQEVRLRGGIPVAVCSSRNVEMVERLGAIAIDYTAGDALEQARAHAPFAVILNAVGTDVYPLRRSRPLLAPDGIIDLVVLKPSDVFPLMFRRDVRSVLGRPSRHYLEPLVKALEERKLEVSIAERFPLAEAERAHERSRSGKVVGKLVLLP